MSPPLPNERHESFAYFVAKGMSLAEAYVHAGYKSSEHSAGAAARLAGMAHVKERIKYLKEEMMAAAVAIIDAPTQENAQRVVDLKLSIEWCAQQFKEIAEEAKAAGQFNAANTAVANIQKIVEMREAKKSKDREDDEPRIKLSDATAFIKEMNRARELELKENEPVPMIDVTPKEVVDD